MIPHRSDVDPFTQQVLKELQETENSADGFEYEELRRVLNHGAEIEHDLGEVQTEANTRHESLVNELAILRQRVATAWGERDSVEKNRAHFNARYDVIADQLNQLDSILDTVGKRLNQLPTSNPVPPAELVGTLKELEELVNQLDDAESSLADAAESVNNFEEWLGSPAVRVDEFETEYDCLQTRFDDAEARLEAFTEDVADPAPAPQTIYEHELDQIRTELNQIQTGLKDLERQVTAEVKWQDRNLDAPQLEPTIDDLQAATADLKSALQRGAANTDELASTIDDQAWNLTRLTGWHKQLSDKVTAPRDQELPAAGADSDILTIEEASARLSKIESAIETHDSVNDPPAGADGVTSLSKLDKELTGVALALGHSEVTIGTEVKSLLRFNSEASETNNDAYSVPKSRVKTGPETAYSQHISNISFDLGSVFSLASVATGVGMTADPVAITSIVAAALGVIYEQSKVEIRDEDGFVCWVAYKAGAGDDPISIEALQKEVEKCREDVSTLIGDDEISIPDSVARLGRQGVLDVTDTDTGREVELRTRVSSSWE